MNEFRDEEKLHHFMGIEMNIQTWNLLGKDGRNKQEDIRMLNFAKVSLYHWRKSPNFELVNEQRGQWLISRVYAVLCEGKEALSYAQETLRLTEENGFKDFDLAYGFEAMARVHAALGNKEKCKEFWKEAREAGDLISGEDDKKYFDGDLDSEPWFGYWQK